MNKLQRLFLTLLLSTSNIAYAVTSLENKAVAKSAYYTGQSGAAKINYISLDNWLSHRAKDDLPKDIYNQGFIVDNPVVVKPLYTIANRLLANWPGNAPKMAIFVRVDTKSSVYGAEALIANEILIHYGTLINVKSDDELAAVLAHELAHILLGHNAKANYANVALQLLNDYESMKNLRDTVQAGHLIKTADKQYELKFDTGLNRDIVKAGEQKKRAAEFYYAYHGSMLGRPAESKADLLAADLLIKADYSPIGLHDTLSRLGSSYTVEKYVSKSLGDASEEVMGAVKVSMNEQIGEFQNQVQGFSDNGTADFSGMPTLSTFSTFTSGVTERLKTSATEFAWKRFKTSHPVPQKRVSKLSNYLDANYGLFERQKSKSTSMLNRYQRNGVKSIASYQKLEQASLKLIEGNIDKAATLSIASLVGSADKDPYKRYTAHRIRQSQNKTSSAIANIERIENYRAVPSNALVEMLDVLIENNRLSTASRIIERKEKYGYVVPHFYPTKIAIELGRKKQDEAKLIASQCVSSKKVSKKIKTQCAEYGLLGSADTAGGGFMKGLKSATSTMTNALNPMKK